MLVTSAAAAAGAQSDGPPVTELSADGRTVSGAERTLSVSQAAGLDPAGQTVTVTGSGYDEAKGVYVSLCVVPPPGAVPSPCGGGVDRENTSGASAWVSSNPPSYADGVSQPYGPGGSFTVSIDISPTLNPTLDCRQVRCAVVTRNDHTRGSDRSQDLLIPVSFAPDPAPTEPTSPTTAAPTTTATTTTTLPPSAFAPDASLSDDGRTVDDGARRLTVSTVADLDPTGATVHVEGSGFAPTEGIYVSLCRIPEPDRAPSPCTSGASGSAWLSSDPPDYGDGLAEPFDDGGFALDLVVPAVIDDATDCREVACAITTHRDDTAVDDRSADLFVPVSFAATAPTTTAADDEADTSGPALVASTSDGGGLVWWPFAAGVVAVGAAATAWLVRRRHPAA